MLEQSFREQASFYSCEPLLVNQLWEEIVHRYAASHRYYHTMQHLEHLHQLMMEVKDQIMDWSTMVFSIAYHDCIYQPLRNNNEERSADIAEKRLKQLNLPLNKRRQCYTQIINTRSHALSHNADTNYFTDADLGILGTPSIQYEIYTAQIRKEYSIYPDIIYYAGRKKVLSHFMAMPKIFKTAFFHDRFEEQARNNMLRELAAIDMKLV